MGQSGLAALSSSLSDSNVHVRRAAAMGLIELKAEAKAATPALLKALQDDDENVRDLAHDALYYISNRRD